MNNYERIKNMSVEGMIELLLNKTRHCDCFLQGVNACPQNIPCYMVDFKICTDGIKQWLLSEVQDV